MIATNLRLDEAEHRMVGLLAVKHTPSLTRNECIRALIRAAAMSDPDVRTWLQAFPETAEEPRELIIG